MMKTKTLIACAVSALALGGATVAVRADQTNAATKAEARAITAAEKAAKKAGVALAGGKAPAAVALAEAAVKLRPQDADYRALLGRSYLSAGRFGSARQALSDALALDPGVAGVPLSLALAETASGDAAAARATLSSNAGRIAPADRGLALALAGDVPAGIAVLETAVRAPDADAKTRQNLALAYALAGRWPEARTLAMIDLPPADADQRIIAWAGFVRPSGQADQVAALLGVKPAADTGQPAMLALQAQPTAVAEAASPDDPVDAYMPAAVVDTGTVAAPEKAPVAFAIKAEEPTVSVPMPAAQPIAAKPVVAEPVVAAAPAEPTVAPPLVTVARVIFGPRKEVVQPIPIPPAKKLAKVAAPAAPATGQGYVVQLGAYRDAAAAKVAWTRVQKSVPALAGRSPSGTRFATKRGKFYRLSVGGFVRPEATDLCVKVKAAGGACFVRAAAGDAIASWATPTVQVAAR